MSAASATVGASRPLIARISEEFAATSGGARRQRALQALTEQGLPTSRDENWKYVNLRPLEKVRFAPPSGDGRVAITAADLPAAVAKSRYVFVDGVLDAALSSPSTQAGVVVTSMAGGARA